MELIGAALIRGADGNGIQELTVGELVLVLGLMNFVLFSGLASLELLRLVTNEDGLSLTESIPIRSCNAIAYELGVR